MSRSRSQSTVKDLIETLDLQENMKAAQVYQQLEPYFSDIEDDSATLENVVIKAGKNAVIAASTSKISNLKFRLKDFLLESLKASVKIQSSMQSSLALTLVVLEFLQKVSALMEYQLSNCDAHTLLEMYILENEKTKITVDALFARLKNTFTEKQILQSLELLEKLSCIQYGADEINLIETILFIQE